MSKRYSFLIHLSKYFRLYDMRLTQMVLIACSFSFFENIIVRIIIKLILPNKYINLCISFLLILKSINSNFSWNILDLMIGIKLNLSLGFKYRNIPFKELKMLSKLLNNLSTHLMIRLFSCLYLSGYLISIK